MLSLLALHIGKKITIGLALGLVAGAALAACRPTTTVPVPTPTVEKTFPTPRPQPTATATAVPTLTPFPTPRPGETPAPTATLPPATPTPAPQIGDAVAGQAFFQKTCNACHPGGKQGLGPSLVGIAGKLGEEKAKAVVRSGKGMMPAFATGGLSETQWTDLWAFLRELR